MSFFSKIFSTKFDQNFQFFFQINRQTIFNSDPGNLTMLPIILLETNRLKPMLDLTDIYKSVFAHETADRPSFSELASKFRKIYNFIGKGRAKDENLNFPITHRVAPYMESESGTGMSTPDYINLINIPSVGAIFDQISSKFKLLIKFHQNLSF